MGFRIFFLILFLFFHIIFLFFHIIFLFFHIIFLFFLHRVFSAHFPPTVQHSFPSFHKWFYSFLFLSSFLPYNMIFFSPFPFFFPSLQYDFLLSISFLLSFPIISFSSFLFLSSFLHYNMIFYFPLPFFFPSL